MSITTNKQKLPEEETAVFDELRRTDAKGTSAIINNIFTPAEHLKILINRRWKFERHIENSDLEKEIFRVTSFPAIAYADEIYNDFEHRYSLLGHIPFQNVDVTFEELFRRIEDSVAGV